jgi:hypothetical protein
VECLQVIGFEGILVRIQLAFFFFKYSMNYTVGLYEGSNPFVGEQLFVGLHT